MTNIIVSLLFCLKVGYLPILVGIETALLSVTMLMVTVEAPQQVVDFLDKTRFGEYLFTFRGRYVFDVLASLFLFAMGRFGLVMGVVTLVLVFGIRFVGVKHPEAFGELFRQPADADGDADNYSLGTDTLESGRR